MANTITYYANEWGLHCYQTGDYLREATRRELRASAEAAGIDGGAGVIDARDLSRPIARKRILEIERSLCEECDRLTVDRFDRQYCRDHR